MLLAFYTHLFFHQNSTYLEKVKDYSLLLSIKVIFKDYDIKYAGILFFRRMFDCDTLSTDFSCRYFRFCLFCELFCFVIWQNLIYLSGCHPCFQSFLEWNLTYLLGIKAKSCHSIPKESSLFGLLYIILFAEMVFEW